MKLVGPDDNSTARGNQSIAIGIASDGVRSGARQIYDGFDNLPTDTGDDVNTSASCTFAFRSGPNLDASSLGLRVPTAPLILDLDGGGHHAAQL